MASFKLYYKIGMIGAIINIVIALIVFVLHDITSYISFFGTVSAGSALVDNLFFSVIAIIGVELSRRKRDIGLTTMAVISLAGIIAFPGVFIIGYIIVIVAVFVGLFLKK